MANLFTALEYTLPWEGGYSNDPLDHGGKTNYGITQATLNRYLDRHPTSNVPDKVELFSVKDAEEIYRADYWKFDGVKSQAVASKLFDMSVNFGVGTAIKMVQRIVGVNDDGFIGPMTIQAINNTLEADLLNRLVNSCIERYSHIIEQDPTQERFRRGWMRRAKSIPALSQPC